jgi:hypothetical protein
MLAAGGRRHRSRRTLTTLMVPLATLPTLTTGSTLAAAAGSALTLTLARALGRWALRPLLNDRGRWITVEVEVLLGLELRRVVDLGLGHHRLLIAHAALAGRVPGIDLDHHVAPLA